MSIKIDALRQNTELRLSAFEAMLTHLDLDPGPDQAVAVHKELQAALRSCMRCATPGRCRGWCDGDHAGLPGFCSGRHNFQRLAVAQRKPDPVSDCGREMWQDTRLKSCAY